MSEEYLEINNIAYDQLADEYRNRRDCPSIYEEKAERLGNALLKYITKEKEQINLVEIGPGAGEMLAFFEENNCRTIGIELSEKMAQIARQFSPRSVLINNDVRDVMLLPGQIQAIYMGAVIHLFPEKEARKLLVKIRQWLDNDGVIFINTTCHEENLEGFFEKGDYHKPEIRFRRYWQEESFVALSKNVGLKS